MAASLAFTACGLHAQNLQTSCKFDFGGKPSSGYTEVPASAAFSDTLGYGFAPGSTVRVLGTGGKSALHDGFATSSKPFSFIQGIRRDHLPIATNIKKQVPQFDPAHPDSFASFDVAPDPDSTDVKAYGN